MSESKNFAIVGVAGYVAPRHLKAIWRTGHRLVAALDKSDSVGRLDAFHPDAAFFTEFERFERHIEKFLSGGEKLDYLVVCSPNYLHDAHIRFGLRFGADVICEKPLVLNPWNVDALLEKEKALGRRIWCVLQLRLHPSVVALREKIASASADKVYDIELTYLTSRGLWYYASWKGDESKSGGIATNIGIHFFDMLHWIFGDVVNNEVHIHSHDRAAGLLTLRRARVSWFLSIDRDALKAVDIPSDQRTYRSLKIDGETFEFSSGFDDLHTACYEAILRGDGLGLEDARPAIEIVRDVRTIQPVRPASHAHPLTALPEKAHPFYRQHGSGNA